MFQNIYRELGSCERKVRKIKQSILKTNHAIHIEEKQAEEEEEQRRLEMKNSSQEESDSISLSSGPSSNKRRRRRSSKKRNEEETTIKNQSNQDTEEDEDISTFSSFTKYFKNTIRDSSPTSHSSNDDSTLDGDNPSGQRSLRRESSNETTIQHLFNKRDSLNHNLKEEIKELLRFLDYYFTFSLFFL